MSLLEIAPKWNFICENCCQTGLDLCKVCFAFFFSLIDAFCGIEWKNTIKADNIWFNPLLNSSIIHLQLYSEYVVHLPETVIAITSLTYIAYKIQITTKQCHTVYESMQHSHTSAWCIKFFFLLYLNSKFSV